MEDEQANYPLETRLLAALAYIALVLGPLLLLAATAFRSQPFLRYHAVQSLVASLGLFALYVILIPGLTWVLNPVPILGGLFAFFAPYLYLAGIVLQLYWAFLAFEGRFFKLPGVRRMARL